MKLKLLALIMILFISQSHAQLKKWYYAPNQIQFVGNNQPPVVTPFCTQSNFANSFFVNQNGHGIYDVNGMLHFYIYGNAVMSGNETFVGNLAFQPNVNQSEIAIVPFNSNGDKCKPNRYYIIYNEFYPWNFCTNNNCWSRLRISLLTTDPLTNNITLRNLININTNTLDFAMSSLNFPDDGNSGIAVSKAQYASPLPTNGPEQYGYRFVYFASGNSIQRITLTEPTATNNNGISLPTTLVNTSTLSNNLPLTNVKFQTKELELSPDGTMLAWGEYASAGNASVINYYNVIGISPAGNYIPNSFRNIQINSNTPVSPRITRGVEFSANSNFLYVSTANTGLYRINLQSATPLISPITNSQNNSGQMIELAGDGRLYVPRQGVNGVSFLDYIDETNLNLVNTQVNITPLQYCLNIDGSAYAVLPDQIDGEDITSLLYKGLMIDAYKYELNASETWNAGSNPIKPNSSIIKINELIYVGNTFNSLPINLNLKNLTIEFGPEGGIVLYRNTALNLENVTLKGLTTCGNMWKGIVAYAQGTDPWNQVNVTIDGRSVIQDAIVGIEMNGTGSYLKTETWGGTNIPGTLFTKNGVDIRLKNINNIAQLKPNSWGQLMPWPDLNIGGSFLDDQVLKNQTNSNFGDALGYSDGLKRTAYSIEIVNCKTDAISIGTAFFKGGQSAIFSNGGSFGSSSCYFTSQKQQAIYANGSNMTIGVNGGEISNTIIGINISNTNTATINVSGVHFNSLDYSGINVTSSVNSKINIGHLDQWIGTIIGNNFTNCFRAINLFYNPSYKKTNTVLFKEVGNEIVINKNTITNCTIGIVMTEVTGNDRKYKSLEINDNVLTNVITGIRLTNIVGGNPINPQYDFVYKSTEPLDKYPRFNIFNNSVNTTQGNYVTTGIASSGGGAFNMYENNIVPKANDKGLDFLNATNTLIYKNYINDLAQGSGLNASAHMLNSNYYCNQFTNCGYGIHLTANHMLRTTGGKHGEPIIASPYNPGMSRDNAYLHNTHYNSDIVLDPIILPNNSGSLSAADFINNSVYNKWIYNLSPVVRSHYPLFAGHGQDKCGYPTDGTGSDNGGITNGLIKLTGASGTLSPYMVWMNENYIQKNYLEDTTGTLDACTNSEVIQLFSVEQFIENSYYDSALMALTNFSPTSDIATDYKIVYTVFCTMQLNNTLLSATDSTLLVGIAQKNSRLVSPAAYTARGILFNLYSMEINDPAETFYPNISGRAGQFCEDIVSDIELYIEDINLNRLNYTVYTDEVGRFVFDGDSLNKLITNWGGVYRIAAILPQETKYTVFRSLNDLFYTDHYLGCSLDKKGKGKTIPETISSSSTSNTPITNNIQLYPNPANNVIKGENIPMGSKYSITNIIGQTVLQGNVNHDGISTNLLPNGLYIIDIMSDLGIKLHQQKLTIQHE